MSSSKRIEFSYVDSELKLSILKACELIEDSVTDFLNKNGVDNSIIRPKYDSLMVVYKHHISINRLPVLNDIESIDTKFSKIKNASFIITTEFNDDLKCSSMLCLINNTTRFPSALASINFAGKEDKDSIPLAFNKIALKDRKYIYSQKVLSTDIDYSNHANNKSYVRYILNALPTSRLKTLNIKEAEVHYLNEALEGDVLDIYMSEEDNRLLFEIARGEEVITRAFFEYE